MRSTRGGRITIDPATASIVATNVYLWNSLRLFALLHCLCYSYKCSFVMYVILPAWWTDAHSFLQLLTYGLLLVTNWRRLSVNRGLNKRLTNFASVYVVSVVESSMVDNRLDFASFYIFFDFLFLIIFQSSRRLLSTVYCRTTVYTKVKRRAGNSGWRTCSFEHESKPCDVRVS